MTTTAIIQVETVRVQNKSGCIFRGKRITPDGEIIDAYSLITVRIPRKGMGTRVMVGQWWHVEGELKNRPCINHLGYEITEEQLEVEPGKAWLKMPSGAHVTRYLARNATYKGIGQVTAELLWKTFRKELFAILDEGDTAALSDVIGPGRATILCQGWAEEGLSGTLQWLHNNEIGLAIGRRVLDVFGKEAQVKVEENPYRLLSFSAGWAEVDALATGQFGIEANDPRRLAGGVEEAFYRAFSKKGHTLVPRKLLADRLASLFNSSRRQLIDLALDHAQQLERLLFDSEGNATSKGAMLLEKQAAKFIVDRLGKKNAGCDTDRIIAAYEAREGYTLEAEQRQAIHLAAEHDLAVITGGAGCGKTTVLKGIYDVLDLQGYKIIQLALAGKAVRRMIESTQQPGQTIASFIKKLREEGPPSELTAVVIDEASMVDVISFAALSEHLPADTKMVVVGDDHQLSPVGPGLILHCLTGLSWVPHVELRAPKRFGTKLYSIASSIKDGVFPGLDKFDSEIRFIETADAALVDAAANLYLESPTDCVVLCNTRAIAKSVNHLIQDALAPGRRPIKTWNVEHSTWMNWGFNEGHQVICTRNWWDRGIQNGSIGRLIEVVKEPNQGEDTPEVLGWIEWDDGVVRPLDEAVFDTIELGYCLTVHKSQGSQWQRVIACLPVSSADSIDRSMVYTAVTRSKGDVAILSNYQKLVKAVTNCKAADRRHVGLGRWLASAMFERAENRQTCPRQDLESVALEHT
mgnify:FL=1